MNSEQLSDFIGHGMIPDRPWYRSENQPITDTTALGHPCRYKTDEGLVDAVNTALLLSKPLLVTGKPGTGKSELAERIAYEFGLGAVLRFEAQSLSEAQDLFYRFDLVGHMAAVHLASNRSDRSTTAMDPHHAVVLPSPVEAPDRGSFIDFGPLGKAILLSDPNTYKDLLRFAFPNAQMPADTPRRSVVLIDEVDKASRDFPNDLLNGIDRMEFNIRELSPVRRIAGAEKGSPFHPIVIVTSNSERDLPAPFLRRCAYFDIPDPGEDRLAEIVRARVFPELEDGSSNGPPPLPDLYAGLLKFFVAARDHGRYGYTPGTSELIDWTKAAKAAGVEGARVDAASLETLKRVASAAVKHPADRQRLLDALLDFPAFRVAMP